jgi:hypothetical protein
MSASSETIAASLAKSRMGSQYSQEIKLQAAGNYLITGNFQTVADQLNIPRRTLTDWSKSEWWQEAITAIRLEKGDELDVLLTNAVFKGVNNAVERLDKGDFLKYDDDNQEVIYKPVSAKDSATTAAILFDKRQILRNQPTSISNNIGNDQLLDLKAQFEQLAGSVNAKVINQETD